jgi:carboxyl-terminal processing protease
MNKIRVLIISFLLALTSISGYAAISSNKIDNSTLKLLDLFGDIFDKVKKEYVEETTDNDLIEAAVNGMLTSLDPHSGYLNEKAFEEMRVQTKGEFGGLGIEVTMENGLVKVITPIDDTPAFKAGIKFGDYIVSINDEPVMGMSLNDAVKLMRGPAGSKIHLTVIREGKNEPIEVDLNREVIKIKSVKAKNQDNIGYIRITSFSEQTADGIKAEIKKMKANKDLKIQGLVLDLRNNPGGLLEQAIDVADAFLDKGEIVSTRGRGENNIIRYNAKNGDMLPDVNIVVLINGGSASASEIVAGALQDHKRAVIMGTRSFGKGSVQSVIPIPSHGAIKLTTARYYTPSGRSIQAEGIVPDVEVQEAKVQFDNNSDTRRMFSEASLKGHLQKEKKELDKAAEKEKIKDLINQLDNNDGDKKISNKNLYDYEKDFQLARAIDLLRGLNIITGKKQ